MAKQKMLGKYVSRDEIKCHCGCGQDIVDNELIDMLDKIREHFGKPIIIHCVNRCERHNKNVGGVPGSKHITGNAADFHIKGIKTSKVVKECKKLWKRKEIITGGFGTYSWGCHVDTGRYRTWSGK